MTDEEINIAIAVACGWSIRTDVKYKAWIPPSGYKQPDCEASEGAMVYPPNYTTNLNAMHDAKMSLSKEERERFEKLLLFIVQEDPNNWSNSTCFATAKQEAKAFVLTISLC